MARYEYSEMDRVFAGAVKVARQTAGLSQEAVAEAMRGLGFDMTQPVVGKIERGQRRVTLGEAEALAAVLGQSTHTLLAGPEFLEIERAAAVTRRLRGDVKEAISKWQNAQMAMAMLLDDQSRRSAEAPAVSEEMAERAIFESVADVAGDLAKDNIAEAEHRRRRDGLEGDGTPVRGADSSPDTWFSRYLAARGDTVSTIPDGDVWSAILGKTDSDDG